MANPVLWEKLFSNVNYTTAYYALNVNNKLLQVKNKQIKKALQKAFVMQLKIIIRKTKYQRKFKYSDKSQKS